MAHHHSLSIADRDTLILQASSAAHCWFVVCVGLLFIAL